MRLGADSPSNGAGLGSGYQYLSGDEIDFLGYSETFFVCFIDIVNSTNTIAKINNPLDVRKYYAIFLNTLARIARDYDGHVVKTAGDGIVLYFPNTSDPTNTDAFKKAMKCCTGVLDAHQSISLITNYENLPPIEYRISADYGRVELAKSRSSKDYDLIGHTMNLCAKINAKAKPGGFVIGSDLHEVLKSLSFPFAEYFEFQIIGEYSSGLKYNYPIFSTRPKKEMPNQLRGEAQRYESKTIKHRIMIIDDEPDLLLTYKDMLESDGFFEVDTYSSSQDALQRLLSMGLNSYDLIITDIRMPPPNGLQLYNIIKTLNKQARVLFITAYDILEEVISMMPDVKRDQVLKKPINKQDLLKEAKLYVAT